MKENMPIPCEQCMTSKNREDREDQIDHCTYGKIAYCAYLELKEQRDQMLEALKFALPELEESGHVSDYEGVSGTCPSGCSLCRVKAAIAAAEKGKDNA